MGDRRLYGSGTGANATAFPFSLFFPLLSKFVFDEFSAVDPIVSVFRIDKLDVSKRKMANLLEKQKDKQTK